MPMPQKEGHREYVERAARKFREDLTALVAEYERKGHSIREVLGDPDDFASRAIQATAPVPSPWDDLIGPCTTSEGVQSRLNVTRQAVAARAARRSLLRVITADGKHLYPTWQFRGSQVLSGLSDVLQLFPEEAVDGWTVAGWLRTPEADLGERPLDALKRGATARVLEVARTAAKALLA